MGITPGLFKAQGEHSHYCVISSTTVRILAWNWFTQPWTLEIFLEYLKRKLFLITLGSERLLIKNIWAYTVTMIPAEGFGGVGLAGLASF